MLKKLTRSAQDSMSIYASGEDRSYGLLAEFPHPGALMHAAEALREAGYRRFDAHSPFPIHGMDRAMGLGNSQVGFFALGGAVTGLALGTWLQWWTSAVDYPINISGKPFFAWEYGMPIMFELTILFAALGTVAGMLALNGLPRPYNPLFFSDRFARASDDGFFLHVAATDALFDPHRTEQVLREAGATHVEAVREEAPGEAAGEHVEDEHVEGEEDRG